MILCSYSIFLLQLSSMKSRKYVYFIKFNGFWSYKICCVKISISQMSDTKALFLCKLFTFYAVIYFYFTTLIQRTLQSATRHQISFKKYDIVKLLTMALTNRTLDLANQVTKRPNLALTLTKSWPGLTL